MKVDSHIRKKIYAPNTFGSGSSRWYAEIRNHGLLMQHGHFDTKAQAKNWLDNQTNAIMSKSVADEYIKMFKRWKHK